MLDNDKLKAPDGYKEIFKALGQIKQAGVVRKSEAFDQFFDECFRRKGQSIGSY